MKKSLDEKREERLKKISELTQKRDAINTELDKLLNLLGGPSSSAEEVPIGFSVTREVQGLFKEHPKLYILQATDLLKKKFPAYNIDRRQVHGSLTYLAERGRVVKVEGERALFARADDTL